MIGMKMRTEYVKETQYVLSVLSSCLGVTLSDLGDPKKTPLLLSYGSTIPTVGIEQVVIHIPEDHERWSSKGAPEDVLSFHHKWTASNTIVLSEDCIYAFYYYLTLQEDKRLPVDQHERIALPNLETHNAPHTAEPLLNNVLLALRRAFIDALASLTLPYVYVAPWPQAKPFAAFLSHDVDRVYDREFFKFLSDVKHLSRVIGKQIPGSVSDCTRRIVRALLRPKDPLDDFLHLLRIEGAYSFRSTFFMLEDRYWARHGVRYRFSDKEISEISHLILDRGCELALHGGYYSFNDAGAYAAAARSFETNFGLKPEGIRNHYMRFSYPETWRAHSEAGFTYDSTLGYHNAPGYRGRLSFPFRVFDAQVNSALDLIELPLTIMDVTLFDYQLLNWQDASSVVERAISNAESGGVITFLWHNQYFNEPKFASWEDVYRQALALLNERGAYVAPGQEIVSWWQRHNLVRLHTDSFLSGVWRGRLEVDAELDGLVIEIVLPAASARVGVQGAKHSLWQDGKRAQVCFAHLAPKTLVHLWVEANEHTRK